MHFRETNWSWQTGQKESVLHFEVVFVVCWHQSGIFVHVVYITVSVFLFKLHIFLSKSSMLMTLKQIFQFESIPCAHLYEILKRKMAKVCFDASFMCLSRFDAFSVTFMIYAVERNVVAYCHAYISKQPTKLNWLVQRNLYYTSKVFL